MIKKIKVKDLHKRKKKANVVGILTVKKIYNKEEVQRFIQQWEEVTKKGSKIETVMLNDEVIEFKGFIRKQPRIVNIPKAVRKLNQEKWNQIFTNKSNEGMASINQNSISDFEYEEVAKEPEEAN